jgi:signal transduction histidine kinase
MLDRPGRPEDVKPRSRWNAVVPDLLLIALILPVMAGISAAGTLDALNHRLIELTLPLSRAGPAAEADVVLVETSNPPPDWQQVVNVLRRLDARLIAFTEMPLGANEAFFANSASKNDVIFAVRARQGREEAAGWVIDSVPSAVTDAGIAPTLSIVPFDRSGARRFQPFAVDVEGQARPTLEASIAARASVGAQPAGNGSFLIDYRGGLDALAKLEVERLLTGNIVRDLIAGRVALIGPAASSDRPQLTAPLGLRVPWITELEYHGFATRTLLKTARPTVPPLLANVAFIAIIMAIVLIAIRITEGARKFWIAGGAALAVAVIGAIAFVRLGLVLPMAETVLALAFFLLLTVLRRAAAIERTARGIAREVAFEVHDQSAASVSGRHAPWRQIAMMAEQTLGIVRSQFFETEVNTSRILRHSVGADGQDVTVEFGNIKDKPFAASLQDSSPTAVTANFQAPDGDRPVDYLTPIRFNEEILGFWGFSLDAPDRAGTPEFQSLLRSFLDQAADFLFAARQQELAAPINEPLEMLGLPVGLGGRAGDPERTLKPLLEIQRHRHILLENVLDGVNTAIIAFDAFGGLLHMNDRMGKLLRSAGIGAGGVTPFTLITGVTDTRADNAKYYLRHVLLEDGSISIPVKLAIRDRRYLLNISPIKYLPRGTPHGAVAAVSLRALLCEITDITVVEQLTSMKDVLSEHLGHRLRNTIAGMFAAADLLTDPRSSEQMRAKIVANLKQTLQLSKSAFERLESFLETPITPEVAQRYPVDLRAMLPVAISEVSADAANRRVNLDLRMPSTVSLVIGGAPGLATLIETMLRVLIQDADEGSTIPVHLHETEDIVVLEVSNKGFGLPDSRMVSLISGPDEPQSTEFRRLRAGAREVEQWGGQFRVTSTMGAGFSFRIELHKIL